MASFENWSVPEVDARCVNKKTLEDDLHGFLNPNICEPVVVEENTLDEGHQSPQGPEVAFINPNTIIDREKSLSERLQGSARNAAKVMMLVTALSALSGFSNDTEAREYRNYKDSVRTEQIDKTEAQKSERKQLTNASRWAGEKVRNAQNDLPHIKNAQDAEWLVKLHMDGFADDFYNAPRNSSGRIAYNTERIYTMDDAQYAIECAKTLKGIMEDLQGRYGVGNYEERQARLDKVISNLEQQTSYSFQREQDARRDMMKQFKFHKYR